MQMTCNRTIPGYVAKNYDLRDFYYTLYSHCMGGLFRGDPDRRSDIFSGKSASDDERFVETPLW